jgi:hypothetical protein
MSAPSAESGERVNEKAIVTSLEQAVVVSLHIVRLIERLQSAYDSDPHNTVAFERVADNLLEVICDQQLVIQWLLKREYERQGDDEDE